MASDKDKKGPCEYSLRKYLLLLATLVVTVTYAAGFSPPGGVWQDGDPSSDRLAGDPIFRNTSYPRYLVFFYCNATAFASSLVVIVLILVLALAHEKDEKTKQEKALCILRVVMVLDLLSLMGAYAAGTCRGPLTVVYTSVLVFLVVVYVVAVATWWSSQTVLASSSERTDPEMAQGSSPEANATQVVSASSSETNDLKRRRKVLMLLATFAVNLNYLAGLSVPGGFLDHVEGGHGPGDAVLKGRHDARLKTFFVSNTTSFVASLAIIVLLLDKNLQASQTQLYGFIVVALIGLVVAYIAGSTRQTDTTVYVTALVGAVLLCILVQVVTVYRFGYAWLKQKEDAWLKKKRDEPSNSAKEAKQHPETRDEKDLERARSLVLLLATLAATITYQAGLNPPGGLWQDDGKDYMAGDPILLTTNPRRYKAFFYCNSVAFVASLVAIILVQNKALLRHHTLEAAMILDLFGLIGAYAAGSCRDVNTSIYAVALAGAVLVYVVIHIVLFTMDHEDNTGRGNDGAAASDGTQSKSDDDELVENRRKRLLVFAILAATITYQAGLTPPSGFRIQGDEMGHQAGDPVLLYNFPRRYKAFFYCNSVSFMLSIALIILLVNRNLYKPAIRSNALSVCTAAGMSCLVGAYAAGSTQHLKTSIYIFVLAAVVLFFVAVLVVVYLRVDGTNTSTPSAQTNPEEEDDEDKKLHSKRKYMMLLGILVASVTFQAGLLPPGGVWPGGSDAGDPVMYDNRRPQYLAFFYSNSTSFVASIVVIILLLPKWKGNPLWHMVMNTTIMLDLLGLLVAYAAGSSRSWKTSAYVSALVVAVLAYFSIHVLLSYLCSKWSGDQRVKERNDEIQEAAP